MTGRYRIILPEYWSTYAEEIAAKGYFADVTVEASGRVYRLTFVDPVRLRQDIELEFAEGARYFHEPNLVVVPTITLALIEAAIRMLAEQDFASLSPEPAPAG